LYAGDVKIKKGVKEKEIQLEGEKGEARTKRIYSSPACQSR